MQMNHQEISICTHPTTPFHREFAQPSVPVFTLAEQLASLHEEVNNTKTLCSMYLSRARSLNKNNAGLEVELQKEKIWHHKHRQAVPALGRSERANAAMSLRIDQMRDLIKTLEQDAKALKQSYPAETACLFDKMASRMSESLVNARSNIKSHLENECA
jgi:hypothetical protein